MLFHGAGGRDCQAVRSDNWDNVVVNKSAGPATDVARLYYDPNLYDMEGWGVEEIVAYYG